MAATVTIWEAANLFAGDDGPNNSKHLVLRSIMLPQLKEKSEEHHPGGAVAAISIGMRSIEALEMTFKVVGSDVQTKGLFGLGSLATRPYTVYGVLRDKQTGRAIERKAVVWGRLMELNESEFEKGKLTEQDHKIGEITRYELYEDKKEVIVFDFFASVWRVNQIDQLTDDRAILRIPSGA
jgi:hypothetical protein